MKKVERSSHLPAAAWAAAAVACALALHAGPAQASQKVYSPIVEEGEFAIEYRGHHDFDGNAEKDGARKMKMELEYGVTDRWATALEGEFERENSDDALSYSATAWENIFQFFEKNRYWLDAGMFVELETPSDRGEPDKAEVKLLLEKSLQHWTHTLNVVFEKELGAHSDGGTELGYAWRSKWRWKRELELGIEGYGNFGKISHMDGFDEQTHQWGPVVSGALPIGHGGDAIKYEIGYLVGLSDATADGSLKWLIEYETHF